MKRTERPTLENALSSDHDEKPYYTVNSLEKGFSIIELLAERGTLGVSEVARHLGQNRSVSNRFLATLRDLGYVAQDSASRYHLTLKLFDLGNKLVHRMEVPSLVRPYMIELQSRHEETVNLACLDNNEVVVVDMVKSNLPLKYDLPIGFRGPAHAAALGKVLLAFGSESDRRGYLESGRLAARTPKTLVEPAEVAAELEKVRTQGYALDREEWAAGIHCVAVPLHNHMSTYALSVSGPSQRMTEAKMEKVLKDLMQVGAHLAAVLGGTVNRTNSGAEPAPRPNPRT